MGDARRINSDRVDFAAGRGYDRQGPLMRSYFIPFAHTKENEEAARARQIRYYFAITRNA
jgi:hypothetical protein